MSKSHQSTARRILALVLALTTVVAVAGACSGDDESTTGSTGVELGSGSLPPSVPEGFPVPEGSVISSTLVDWDNGRTEVIFRVPAAAGAVILFYDQNLERTGYTVLSSDGDATMRLITFTGNDIEGEIEIAREGDGVTLVILTFDH